MSIVALSPSADCSEMAFGIYLYLSIYLSIYLYIYIDIYISEFGCMHEGMRVA